MAITSNLYPVENIRHVHQSLRALRKLLFIETLKITEQIEVKSNIIDKTLVLHHLFSRISKDYLSSPNIGMGLNIEKYSDWLNENKNDKVTIYRNLNRCILECSKLIETKNIQKEEKDEILNVIQIFEKIVKDEILIT